MAEKRLNVTFERDWRGGKEMPVMMTKGKKYFMRQAGNTHTRIENTF